jgi:hypothetical protein
MLLFCHLYGTDAVAILIEHVKVGRLKQEKVINKIERYLNELSWLLPNDILKICEFLNSSKKNAFLRFNKQREPELVIQEIHVEKLNADAEDGEAKEGQKKVAKAAAMEIKV